MKKICLLAILFMVSGCIKAGNHNILGIRNDIFTAWNGYWISSYKNKDDELHVVKTETIEEKSYKPNVAKTIKVGHSILNSRIYQKKYFEESFYKFNKNCFLNSSSMPVKVSADKEYKNILGTVTIDGKKHYLMPSELDGYALILNEDWIITDKIGQIDGHFLIILQTEFFPYPKDVKLERITLSKTEQTAAIKGFDVKYDGVKLDRIWFTYMDYSEDNSGAFQNISFPNKPGLITINNIGFRVLKADENSITFMVLTL